MTLTRTTLAVGLAVLFRTAPVRAQTREPLCTIARVRRLLALSDFAPAPGERMAFASFPTSPTGTRPARAAALLPSVRPGGSSSASPGADATGITVLRVDESLAVVGRPEFVRLPDSPRATARMPVAVSVENGILVLARADDTLMSFVVPAEGPPTAPTVVATLPPIDPAHTSPSASPSPVAHGFAWLTATARDNATVVALAGTTDGQVVAVTLRPDGRPTSMAHVWPRRVGGPMQLLPLPNGPLAAFVGRPVPGTGPRNEQARVQVLVHLDERLEPAGELFATGFAQFPFATLARGRSLVVFQWSETQGLAIATLPVGERRVGEQLPRLWTAVPPIDGAPAGHAAALGTNSIAYDSALYVEDNGGVRLHLAWLPPDGVPVIRRDVFATRMLLGTPPVSLAADDGVVTLLAGRDETGSALDAVHLHCELVTVPPRGPSD